MIIMFKEMILPIAPFGYNLKYPRVSSHPNLWRYRSDSNDDW